MKNFTILFLSILLVSVNVVCSQQESETLFRYGLKAGLNIASLNGKHNNLHLNQNTVLEPSSKYGLVIGGVMSMDFSEQFTAQIELNYTNLGVVYDAEEYVQTWALDYIELPILFKSVFTMKDRYPASLFIGPVLAYNINATWSDKVLSDYVHEDQKLNNIKTFDFAVAFGGSVEFDAWTGTMGFDGRYTWGLQTIKDGISIQNGVISLSMYYLFSFDEQNY